MPRSSLNVTYRNSWFLDLSEPSDESCSTRQSLNIIPRGKKYMYYFLASHINVTNVFSPVDKQAKNLRRPTKKK